MHKVTKRSMIAGAAVAAAGLFGSLPYTGATMAQQDAPTVHQDVALVDVSTDAAAFDPAALLNVEGLFNGILNDYSVADNGLLDVLYTSAGTPLATDLFYTDGPGGIYGSVLGGDEYLDVFNGSATAGYNGLISDTLAFEAELNNVLGVDTTASQSYLLDQFNALYVGDIPGTLDAPTTGDTFIPDLVAIANANYTIASTDLIAYTQNLFTNYADIVNDLSGANLGDVLGDLTQGLAALSTGLTDNVNDLITAIITLF